MPAAKNTALALVSLAFAVLAAAGPAWGDRPDGPRDNEKPSAPTNIRVVSATQTTVSFAWDPSVDDVGIGGYYLSVDKRRELVDEVLAPTHIADELRCGESVIVWIVAFDLSGNKSERASGTVSTAPCPDTRPPTDPGGFRQSATSANAIVLAWNQSSDDVGVVGYGIYRNALPIGSSTEASATLTGLTCGSTYDYAVDAYDGAGNRSQRSPVWVATAACSSGDSNPPSAPTGVSTTATTTSSIGVSWSPSTDNVGVAGYDLYRNGTKVGTTSGTGYTFTALACGTSYTLGVAATDAAGNRSAAGTVAGSTQACSGSPPTDTTAPSRPGNPAVISSTSTSVSLGWAAATDNVSVSGYGVYVNGALVVTASQLSASVSGLACGVAYTFGVDAYDAAGNRSARADVIGTTSGCADSQPPTAPVNVSASSRTGTSIALTWSPSADNVGVAGYGLYRAGTLVGTSSTTTGIFSGLVCNTNYTLAVDAYDGAGNRSTKTTVMVATTACVDTIAPSTPTGLASSNVTQTALTLVWNASTDNVGVTGYDVYRNGNRVASVTGTTVGQSGLACGTSYTFAVRALDAAGNASQAQLTVPTAACSVSSVSYPASYYTGPLGSRNLLPSKPGAFLIDMWGGIGTTTDQFHGAVAARESAMGRAFDGLHIHYDGGGTYAGQSTCVAPDRITERGPQWIHERGSLPLVSWSPNRTIEDVNAGSVDQCFRNVAEHFKSFNFPIMLRLWWEFNLNGPSWHGCGQPFIDAWRRVVQIFKEQGALNVGFWWVPYEHADHPCIDSSYPGDQYVDWVGSDMYNFCLVGESSCWSTPRHSGWAQFWEIADHNSYPTVHDKYGARKPFVIGELGTVYDPNAANQKGAWFREMATAMRGMEYLRGISFYDADVTAAEGARNNFRVDYPTSNPDVFAGFVQTARDPWLNAR